MFSQDHSLWQPIRSLDDNKHQARLAEIQAELQDLLGARARLLQRLSQLRRELFARKQEGLAVRNWSIDLLRSLEADPGKQEGRELTDHEEERFQQIDGLCAQLNREVEEIERRTRIAFFEAASLRESLFSLRDEIIHMAEGTLNSDPPPPQGMRH